MWRLLLAGFLVAHALIHASYLAPAPPAAAAGGPPWPFHLDRSWLLTRLHVPEAAMLSAGRVLVTVTILGFGVAALGLLVGASWWAPAAVAAATVSLVQLTVWFHWWLPVGVAIDVALIAALVWGSLPEWEGLSR